jgi:O-antigen biosynthesis protein
VDSIYYHIDKVDIINDKVDIIGWGFSIADKEKINITIEGIDDKEIKEISRPDVFSIHNQFQQCSECGFQLKFYIPKKKAVNLILKDSISTIEYTVNIRQLIKNKSRQKIKYVVNLINMTNVKKCIQYTKNRGFKAFIHKVQLEINLRKMDYNKWFIMNQPSRKEFELQKVQRFNYEPLISIVVPTFNTKKNFIEDMINSVINQTYSNWELCIADGASSLKETIYALKKYQLDDSRIKVKFLDQNYMISGNTNEALKMTNGDYIGLFDHDDILAPNCLYEVVKAINEYNADFIYTDEDKVDELNKTFSNPNFKPDWSPDTLRSYNYICHFTVIKKVLLNNVGWFRSEFDGSQDYDLFLRSTEKAENIYHIPKVLYHWRMHSNSTAQDVSAKSYVMDAAKKALLEHLQRINLEGNVEDGEYPTTYKINYKIIGNPKISIVIPNKECIDELKTCINSIIQKTTYLNYEIIIVENNSTSQQIIEYYKQLSKNEKIKVVYWEHKRFNYSAINNFGVKHANGDYIVLLNNDTEIITPNWIEEMLMFAQRSEVGIVGSKLYYFDDTIQHAGVILGIGGVAGHSHKYFHKNDPGYSTRLKISQNFSAVTAACLMISKRIYDEVEGLDEYLKVAFNDVDLCMKVRELGRLIVWTPYAEMYHYESKSRGAEDTPEKIIRFQEEINEFKKKWSSHIEKGDPYYNPNLTLETEDFALNLAEKI